MARIVKVALLVVAALLVAQYWASRGGTSTPAGPGTSERPAAVSEYSDALPREAHATLDAIARGGPFRYDRDGSVFQNREGLLPQRPRGYYREYTVDTPGSPDRGARRIVTGGEPPEVYYYTDDHYRSFRSIDGTPR
jgi:guanyl-specific ribonuclease Sa